jgi:hypothetical protein
LLHGYEISEAKMLARSDARNNCDSRFMIRGSRESSSRSFTITNSLARSYAVFMNPELASGTRNVHYASLVTTVHPYSARSAG